MRETNESKPSDEASKTRLATSKPRAHPDLGNSMRDICLLIMRCPVYRRRETHLGSCVELGNLFGDAKGKSSSGDNREAESTNGSYADIGIRPIMPQLGLCRIAACNPGKSGP